MQRTIKARYTKGHIVPSEELNMEEGEEVLVVVEERIHDSVEAEDSGLARAIAEGLSSEPVGKQQVIGILQSRDESLMLASNRRTLVLYRLACNR